MEIGRIASVILLAMARILRILGSVYVALAIVTAGLLYTAAWILVKVAGDGERSVLPVAAVLLVSAIIVLVAVWWSRRNSVLRTPSATGDR